MRQSATTAPKRVFLRAETDVDYRQFMAVMNTLNAEGFHQVGLLKSNGPRPQLRPYCTVWRGGVGAAG